MIVEIDIDTLQKRKETLISDLQEEWINRDINERHRLEGQIRELNNLLYIINRKGRLT